MIQVWTGSREGHQASGVLDRSGSSGSTFVYTPPIDQTRAVSLTMWTCNASVPVQRVLC